MSALAFTDLDADPHLIEPVLALYLACRSGHEHVVCGDPWRMGRRPSAEDLRSALGVLVARRDGQVAGALAICPYSETQVTLWGPVVAGPCRRTGIGSALFQEARRAIAQGGFESLRMLVDGRNRVGRAFCRSKGLTAWKDNHVYERSLLTPLPSRPVGVDLAGPNDLEEVRAILADAFPSSAHCERALVDREADGYRHPILRHDGRVAGCAAVKALGDRGWISLVAVRSDLRGRGMGAPLLAGVLHLEAARGATGIGLEVLADNFPAIALYERLECRRAWTATIMTGPC